MLREWAKKWNVPPEALRELVAELDTGPGGHEGKSETAVQAHVTLTASLRGWRLWRNNVGAFKDPESKRWVRYGLCNESKRQNSHFKSSDLIGIKPVFVTQQHVGSTIGQFVAVEVKEGDWTPGKDKREEQQAAFIELVKSLGGIGGFSTGGLP